MLHEQKLMVNEVVKGIIRDKIESLIDNDLFMDNELRDRVWNNLPEELRRVEEIEKGIFEGEDGFVDCEKDITKLVDSLTKIFMNRFQ